MRECAYLIRLSTPSLPGVETWWIDLDGYAARVPLDGLSADECARATSFTFGTDARRFKVRRHALRSILAARAEQAPEALEFRTCRLGKPFLVNAPHLQFSSSQSRAEAAIAVGDGQPVGVDIEVVRAINDADALTQLHFAANERAAWLKEAGVRADHAFLTCWTRKEACVKALGVGFRLAPESMEVGCSHGVRVVEISGSTSARRLEVESMPSPVRGIIAVAR